MPVTLPRSGHLLLVFGGIDDDTDGEQVVYAFKAAFLFLHLLPNAVNALCAAFHVKLEASRAEFFVDRADETFNVCVA